jgi:CBS domain-containing protein
MRIGRYGADLFIRVLMFIRCARLFIAFCSLLSIVACVSPGPTGPEIADSLRRENENTIRSAAGPWNGLASLGAVRLEFSLTQTADGRLQGAGTMRDVQAAAAVPITVAGTYIRRTSR